MKAALARALDLRAGDLDRAWPLVAYLFLMIACYKLGRVAGDALFLDRFPATMLPYVDITVAALAGLLIALYVRAGHGVSLRALQVVSLLVFAATIVFCWWGIHEAHWLWLRPVFYVWAGIGGVLAISQVWTLANYTMTTRQARRLFVLVGTGGIAGGIAGGFGGHWIVRQWGTDALLLAMAAPLPLCAVLVSVAWRRRHDHAARPAPVTGAPAARRPHRMVDAIRTIAHSRHLKMIALLMCLSQIASTAAYWQLRAIAKATLVNTDALAGFLSAFTGYVGLASLLAQLLLTTRLLRRFGVGVALLVLPVSLVAGSVLVLASGALWAAAVLKGGDGVFGDSVDNAALQLLYLPLPHTVKLPVKSFIDTVVSKFGDGLAALMVLVLVTWLHFSVRSVGWLVLAVAGLWIVAAVVARHEYVRALRDKIAHLGIQPDQASVQALDRATTDVFAEKLDSSDPDEVLYALTLFEMGLQRQPHAALRPLLDHPVAAVRQRALVILGDAGDRDVVGRARTLLRDPHVEVRAEALRYLMRHQPVDPLTAIDQLTDFADASIASATVAYLAAPGERRNLDAAQLILDRLARDRGPAGALSRREAARLIAVLPAPLEAGLDALLADDDPDVAREALVTAALRRQPKFVPGVVARLTDAALSTSAMDALVEMGDLSIGALRQLLANDALPLGLREEAGQALLRIGTPAAASALSEALVQSDLVIRSAILAALNRLYEPGCGLPLDRTQVETVMVAELMGHYRSYQLAGAAGADQLLRATMSGELERIFRLMSLLFPSLELRDAYFGVQSTDPVVHANALEFLDNTLSPRLRRLLVPLIDSEVSIDERLRLAERYLGLSGQPPASPGALQV